MPSVTIRLMSANGNGFSNAALTMLNSPVAAAIPTARETTAVAAKPGLRRKLRSAYRRSSVRMSSKKFSSALPAHLRDCGFGRLEVLDVDRVRAGGHRFLAPEFRSWLHATFIDDRLAVDFHANTVVGDGDESVDAPLKTESSRPVHTEVVGPDRQRAVGVSLLVAS